MKKYFPLFIICVSSALSHTIAHSQTETTEAELLALLQSGQHVAIMRHAIAPGLGDPENFSLDQCNTQRNLSETGRQQARDTGGKLHQHGISSANIYSSQWCRCLETARLLDVGDVTGLPLLNSFFRNYSRESRQTRELREWIRQQNLNQPTVLVTHQVNITAWTGVFPNSGEMIIVRVGNDGEAIVAGRVKT